MSLPCLKRYIKKSRFLKLIIDIQIMIIKISNAQMCEYSDFHIFSSVLIKLTIEIVSKFGV